MKRQEIDEKYKWDLSEFYTSFEELESDIKRFPPLLENLKKYEGHLLDSSNTLLRYIEESEACESILEDMDIYVHLILEADINNEEAKKYDGVVNGLIAQYNSVMSFVVPELLQNDFSVIEKYCKEEKKLEPYEKCFKDIYRLKEHTLSANEEAILMDFNSIIQNVSRCSQFIRTKEVEYGTITLDNGEKVKLNESLKDLYAKDESRNIRRQVSEQSRKSIMHNINSLATNYITYVKSCETQSKYRHYSSLLEQKLYEEKIAKKAYTLLLDKVIEYRPFFKDYASLYQEVLEVEKLYHYDLSAPLVKGANKKYSVEEAKDLLFRAFSFYGSWYLDALSVAFDQKCIDFLPSEEKSSGWFCSFIPRKKPRVLCNFYNKILDVSSIAHELGHFVNDYLVMEKQIPAYTFQAIFCSEIASLTNEIVFSKTLKEYEKDKSILLEILANYLKVFAGNFFGAARQALFEDYVHKAVIANEPLNAEILNQQWVRIAEEVCGKDILDPLETFWAEIPHFFVDRGYYTYNYTMAIVAASNVAHKLLTHEEGFMEKYEKFLSTGSSIDPMDALNIMGIDMCDGKTYDTALSMFHDAIQEFRELYRSGGEV